MTHEDSNVKANRLLKEKRVELEFETDNNIFYKVKGYTDTHTTKYNKRKKLWTCNCRSGGIKPQENCSHIKASQLKKVLGNKESFWESAC